MRHPPTIAIAGDLFRRNILQTNELHAIRGLCNTLGLLQFGISPHQHPLASRPDRIGAPARYLNTTRRAGRSGPNRRTQYPSLDGELATDEIGIASPELSSPELSWRLGAMLVARPPIVAPCNSTD